MTRRSVGKAVVAGLLAALPLGCGGRQPAGPAPARKDTAGKAEAGRPAGEMAAPPAAGAPVKMELSAPPAGTQAFDPAHLAKAQVLLNGGIGYLLSQREADGGWSLGGGVMKPAITGLVLKALLGHPDFHRDSPIIRKGLEVLLSYQQSDGAVFDPKQGRPAYSTAIAIMAMAASGDPQLNGPIRRASQYLQGIQIQPGQESPDGGTVGPDDPKVGGVGYGSNKEPNLSVLGFVMDAWHDEGLKPDHEAMQRAVGFLTRLQNRSESNPLAWAKEGANDGGFTYDLKESKAGEGPGGVGMRSYGSMTYTGFKSMLYAGVDRNDPRVQAAYAWIRRYWRLDSNPNMPAIRSHEGLFYYYHVFAKALRAWGQDEVPDFKQEGARHNWRNELVDALAERANPDGSWTNKDAERWEEGNPILSTCYGVLALGEALR